MSVENNLKAMGIVLPQPSTPAANYQPYVITGKQLYISGQLPIGANGLEYIGQLGRNIELTQGYNAARLCALNILAQAKAALQDLGYIQNLIKLTGFVNAAPDFQDHPKVINGASDFFAKVLGENGRHARSAVGVASLPFGAAVEIEAILAI